MPGMHAAHNDWLETLANPATQEAQTWDRAAENVPASHGVQMSDPETVESVGISVCEPAAHVKQLSRSACGAYIPAKHGRHAEKSKINMPPAQLKHTVALSPEKEPTAHSAHSSDAPGKDENLPLAHGKQFVEPVFT